VNIKIPELSLVVLIGASGSGKSTFARKHFLPTEIISSDFCRALVSDDENNQEATNPAFEVLHFIARKRLALGKLTVIDATNVQPEARKPLLELAREFHMMAVAIVLKIPERLCYERNAQRPDRAFGPHVVRRQYTQLRQTLHKLEKDGFRYVHVLDSVEDVDNAAITREPMWNNRTQDHGPFDIIGDIHGCFDELHTLMTNLGYQIEAHAEGYTVMPPEGRRALFLGDLGDRGPKTPDVYKLVMGMVAEGKALCVPGNHDVKLLRRLHGKSTTPPSHGLGLTLEQLAAEPPELTERVKTFIDGLISHYVLDDGKLVVAHAGMKESMQGRGSGAVREFALYGETTGERDEFGLPVRLNWATEYRGKAMVVYGHTPTPDAEWLNNTINIDTGCVFGGKLTALRYPERELISVPAAHTYAESAKPFLAAENQAPALTFQQQLDDMLSLDDVIGKRLIETQLYGKVIIREENAAAALEVMSRFTVNPRWLIYLPPTMSPSETSRQPGLLEHPTEAFNFYRSQGIPRVICEEKHMGSRVVVIVCRDEDTTRKRFGVIGEGIGICYTRTGRRFFNDPALEAGLLARVHAALTASRLWEELNTDWVCLDAELMPWSAKAQDLLRNQYAAVGVAARTSLNLANQALAQLSARGLDTNGLAERFAVREELATQYTQAYQRYCWPVATLDDLKLALFHLLASEGAVHTNKDHTWHMQMLQKLCDADNGLLFKTRHQTIDLLDEQNLSNGVAWWMELTERGGEGMVVKPLDFITRGQRGIVQPAVKVRGKEYLRIIYGLEYSLPENLERLRSRGLSAKRSLALREFALGIEGLERFIRREPLRKVHECAFGVLAMESEPIDPRL